jgi:hypothetical protein
VKSVAAERRYCFYRLSLAASLGLRTKSPLQDSYTLVFSCALHALIARALNPVPKLMAVCEPNTANDTRFELSRSSNPPRP